MGKRGPQKGTTYAPTRAKAELRSALSAVFEKHMEDMLAAQIANAKGLSYLVARNAKTGKFEKVTSAMLDAESTDHEAIEVWEKDPSVQAWTDLANRVMDKPTESVDMHVSGDAEFVARLQSARKRVGK